MAEYTLNNVEEKRAEKFSKKHYKKCKSDVSVILTNTGIGLNACIRCNSCSKIKDITDYDSW